MRRFRAAAAMIVTLAALWGPAYADNVAGTWTKTGHPDPHNIVVFFTDGQVVKAVGYEQVGGAPAYWHGDGAIENGQVELMYRYSAEATPFGWEPEGRMQLTLSEDGRSLRGVAISRSGDWSDRIELQRISFVMQR
jgi:hypothetical protein